MEILFGILVIIGLGFFIYSAVMLDRGQREIDRGLGMLSDGLQQIIDGLTENHNEH